MKIRSRSLSSGWYPEGKDEVEATIRSWLAGGAPRTAGGGIVPHAGWFYSGRLACRVFERLNTDVDTVVVCGGHLASRHPILAAREDGFATPQGTIEADLELLSRIGEAVELSDDRFSDNSVEVQLPFVGHFFPKAKLVWLRVPPDTVRAPALGLAIREASSSLGRKIAVVGATDLTHYGENYGFSPKGTGKKAEAWVRDENDAAIVAAFLKSDGEEAIRLAETTLSACSAGAAAACIAFCSASGMGRAELVEYATSIDSGGPSDSFVGYAAVTYSAGPTTP
jgi:MEMO1 family protein